MVGVSPSTVWRWVDAGKLPALRIGPKAIRIRRADIDSAVRVRGSEHEPRRWMDKVYTSIDELRRPMTADEKRQAKAAIDRAARYARKITARRGGKLMPDSADIIREAREGRSRQI